MTIITDIYSQEQENQNNGKQIQKSNNRETMGPQKTKTIKSQEKKDLFNKQNCHNLN